MKFRYPIGLSPLSLMHIEKIFEQQVKFLSADTAFVIVEVMAQKQTNLPDAACLGVAMPLPHPRIECTTDDAHHRSDGGAHVVTGKNLYLLLRKNNGDFGMIGANYAQGFRPTDMFGYDVTRLFLGFLHKDLLFIGQVTPRYVS